MDGGADGLLSANAKASVRERLTLIRVFEELGRSATEAATTQFAATRGAGGNSSELDGGSLSGPSCSIARMRCLPGMTRGLKTGHASLR